VFTNHNVEKRDTECPYYERMHKLLRDNPSTDKSAVMNSQTIGDLNLVRKAPKNKVDIDGNDLEESSEGESRRGNLGMVGYKSQGAESPDQVSVS
jgi:hypothetical protein